MSTSEFGTYDPAYNTENFKQTWPITNIYITYLYSSFGSSEWVSTVC